MILERFATVQLNEKDLVPLDIDISISPSPSLSSSLKPNNSTSASRSTMNGTSSTLAQRTTTSGTNITTIGKSNGQVSSYSTNSFLFDIDIRFDSNLHLYTVYIGEEGVGVVFQKLFL